MIPTTTPSPSNVNPTMKRVLLEEPDRSPCIRSSIHAPPGPFARASVLRVWRTSDRLRLPEHLSDAAGSSPQLRIGASRIG